MAIDSIVLSLFVLILFYNPLMALSADIATAITPEAMQKVYDDLRVFNRQSLPYIFVLYLLYHGLLIWQSGMTLGKYIMKIKVVNTEDGERLDLSKSMIRALARTAGELFLFYLTFLPAFFSPLRQTLQDKLAGSVVIDMRIQG
jgi:uncharacterized RDD family membrane protein YckC